MRAESPLVVIRNCFNCWLSFSNRMSYFYIVILSYLLLFCCGFLHFPLPELKGAGPFTSAHVFLYLCYDAIWWNLPHNNCWEVQTQTWRLARNRDKAQKQLRGQDWCERIQVDSNKLADTCDSTPTFISEGPTVQEDVEVEPERGHRAVSRCRQGRIDGQFRWEWPTVVLQEHTVIRSMKHESVSVTFVIY